MSINKFLVGTGLATPAIGGGGYVTYKELTKEEASSESPTVSEEIAKENVEGGEGQSPTKDPSKTEGTPSGDNAVAPLIVQPSEAEVEKSVTGPNGKGLTTTGISDETS